MEYSESVNVAIRVRDHLNPSSNSNAVLIKPRVGNASIHPDAVSPMDAIRAGIEVISGELEVVFAINSPTGAFSIAGRWLSACGVADLALALVHSILVSIFQGF